MNEAVTRAKAWNGDWKMKMRITLALVALGLLAATGCTVEAVIDCDVTPNDPACVVDCDVTPNDPACLPVCTPDPVTGFCPSVLTINWDPGIGGVPAGECPPNAVVDVSVTDNRHL
jgi:hypothetical protein